MILSNSLPYTLVTRSGAVATLPAQLRHSVLLRGYGSEVDRAMESPSFSVRVSLPSLNSRRLGIQFDPATQADADTLAAARSGGVSALPVYLVNVVPRVKVDGVALGSGNPIRMGSNFFLDVVLQSPVDATVLAYEVVAGDEIVVGVTGNGLAKEVIEKRFAANPVDNAPEYLHQVQLHYWMESDHFARLTARAMDVQMLRLPSAGLFSSPLKVSTLFGMPRWGVYQHQSMDVKQTLFGAASADPSRLIAFMRQTGIQGSYLEGSVFEQLKDHSAGDYQRGISAAHLLSVAGDQGIPIYYINSSNAAMVLPLLALSPEVERDVSAAVSSGKTVLVPERNVEIGSWRGVGYIIQDETTGTGAYMISGGLAGGGLIKCLEKLIPIFETVGMLFLATALALLLLLIFVGGLGTGPLGVPVAVGAGGAMLALILGRTSLSPLASLDSIIEV